MKPINLYMLTREKDPQVFPLYEQHLSGREEVKRSNAHEQESLRSLVSRILEHREKETCVMAENLGGFYFSYTIRHISKEFDLLKFSRDGSQILNIELKSGEVGEERMREQLVQNRYYLGHLSEKIASYTYVSSVDRLYTLNAHSYLVSCSMDDLRKVLVSLPFKEAAEGNIDEWFDAVYYLISPLRTPEKFLNGEYFLTNQQYDFQKQIMKILRTGKRPVMIGIGGSAGTGKTLLLYDLAMLLSRKKKVVVLHCGSLCEGHRVIDKKLRNVKIFSLTGERAWQDGSENKYSADSEGDITERIIKDCDYLLVDEAGRMKSDTFLRISELIREKKTAGIFSCDTERFRFADQDGGILSEKMKEQMNTMLILSGNIRINRSVTSFERYLFDQKNVPAKKEFPSVDIRCAHGREELSVLLSWYRERGYVTPPDKNFTETGMEYERVLMVLDGRYTYEEDGRLAGGRKEEESLSNLRILYDGIARVREKLCLIILDNDDLFATLMRMMLQ